MASTLLVNADNRYMFTSMKTKHGRPDWLKRHCIKEASRPRMQD
uniref:Uncharacterized protein n=1 Tax=Arundo donax TaxID=35708 RepID=A0A0A9A0P9_ARUDO